MSGRTMVETGAGMIAEPLGITTVDGKLTEQAAASLSGNLAAFVKAFNGGISFGDGTKSSRAGNHDAQLIEHTFATADAEESIPHDLGRVPWGYFIAGQDGAGSVYVSNKGGWGADRLFLKSSAGPRTYVLVIF